MAQNDTPVGLSWYVGFVAMTSFDGWVEWGAGLAADGEAVFEEAKGGVGGKGEEGGGDGSGEDERVVHAGDAAEGEFAESQVQNDDSLHRGGTADGVLGPGNGDGLRAGEMAQLRGTAWAARGE